MGGSGAGFPGTDPDEQEVSGYAGAGGLCAFEGAEAGDLFVSGRPDVRALSWESRARGAGCADVRGVGNRLPEVRPMRISEGDAGGAGRRHERTGAADDGGCVHEDASGDREDGPADGAEPVPVRMGRGVAVGSLGGRKPLADHGAISRTSTRRWRRSGLGRRV